MAVKDPNLTPEQQKQVDALKRAAFSSFYNRMRMQASRGRGGGGISFGRAASQLKESDYGLKGVEEAFLQGGLEDTAKKALEGAEDFYLQGGIEDAFDAAGEELERALKPETEDKLKEAIAKQTEEVRKITEKQKKRLSDEQRQFAVRRAARARARRAGRTSLVSPGRLGYGGTLGA